jgi:hypothetical protein
VSRTECSSVKQGREASTSREKFATRVGCGSIVAFVLIFPKISTLLLGSDIPRAAKTIPLAILCIACSALCAYLWRSRQKRKGGKLPDRGDGANAREDTEDESR